MAALMPSYAFIPLCNFLTFNNYQLLLTWAPFKLLYIFEAGEVPVLYATTLLINGDQLKLAKSTDLGAPLNIKASHKQVPPMPPSQSTLERGNPPPRKKSCTACIKAKRRCDLGVPDCLRCSQRGLECKYPPTQTPRRKPATGRTERPLGQGPPDSSPPELSAIDEGPLDTETDQPAEPLPWNTQQDVSQGQAGTGVSLPPILTNASTPMDCGLNTLDFLIDPNDDQLNNLFTSMGGLPSTLIPSPSTEVALPTKSQKGLADMVAKTIATRLQYGIDKIIKAPKMMITENQTPWCHRHLYEDYMPRSMQDAYLCCGLYAAKNEVNSGAIMRIIDARVQDLVSTPLPTARFELIARTHALLLYQIIRLFDGNIQARGSAEATRPALENAALALLEHITSDPAPSPSSTACIETLPLYPLSATREFWQNWMFQESARRTFLVTFLMLQIYRYLSGDIPVQCDARMYKCYSWTLSAYLWEAADAVDFSLAWKEKNHFVVTSSNILDLLSEARADDVDAFGRILLTALMGIDEAKGWFLTRGGSL